jgi:sarcosine oxidase
MLSDHYDVVVLGIGGVGSAALYQLAKRGVRVLGIDRFPPGHALGSSHGETRIIRQAYFEHSDYVPLALRAYELWHELEQRVNKQLFSQVGLLQVGPAEGHVVSGVLRSAKNHSLSVEQLDRQQLVQRFPGFHFPANAIGVFEKRAGYLRVEASVLAHAQAAVELGAQLSVGVTVQEINSESNGVKIVTSSGTIRANKIVVSPGPWASQILAFAQHKLQVRRKHVYWMSTASPQLHEQSGCPTFLFELPHGVFYGFPVRDNLGLKVAEHTGGEVVPHPPSQAYTAFNNTDFQRVNTFLREFMPLVSETRLHHSTCYYTMTPDEHFLVDVQPENPRIAFAAGLSGHGFKFTPVLGEALADLALEGKTELPIGFLRWNRW